MSNSLTILAAMMLAAIIGNCNGDQATLRDCATSGRAVMLGGGEIRCEVVRDLQ